MRINDTNIELEILSNDNTLPLHARNMIKQNIITVENNVLSNAMGLHRVMTWREKLAYFLLRGNLKIRPQDEN